MLRLVKYLAPYKGTVFAVMLMYALSAVCSLLMPFVMSNIIEFGIRQEDMAYIWWMCGAMMGLALLSMTFALITNYLNSVMVSKLSVTMRKQVFEKVNSLDVEKFGKVGTGSLITRTTEDISWLEEIAGQLPYVVVTVPVMFVGGVVLSMLYDYVLALILLAVSPLILLVIALITKGMEKRWQRGELYTDIQNKIIRERLSGIRVIRAFEKDSYEHARSSKATRVMCNCFVRNNTISGIITPLGTLLLNIATVAIIYVGSRRLQTISWLDAADIIATIQYIALIGNAIMIMAWTIAFVPRIKITMQRIDEVANLAYGEQQEQSDRQLNGDIKFEHVNFAYGDGKGEDVLTDINIDIRKGDVVGIIGGTGSGKTTLVKLIMNFYENVRGNRTLDSVDYSELTQADVRNNIAIALQKSMIFEGTVEENIKMGNKDATEQQVMNAVDVAQLKQFVESHEEGLQYKLIQAGGNLSGGQKQRVNIARSIIKDASVYIFDDSFSALDYLTERNLRRKLNVYLKDKTQIIVTQRAATAMRCDKVYVMDEGKIVGCGTHKQLLKDCSVYKEIYDSQLGGDGNVGE